MSMVPVLFAIGVVFGYLIVLPAATSFLQNFNSDEFNVLVQAKDYYKFAALLLLAMGLVFQLPVGILALTRLGVVTVPMLRKNRRYAILVLAVVAAALPGVDPVTMLIELVPLVLLYEMSIQIARVFGGPQVEHSRWAWNLDDEDDDEDEWTTRTTTTLYPQADKCCSIFVLVAVAGPSKSSTPASRSSWAAVSSCSGSAATSREGCSTRSRRTRQLESTTSSRRTSSPRRSASSQPARPAGWANLAKVRYQSRPQRGFDETQGPFTEDGQKDLASVETAWARYLRLKRDKAKGDASIALLMVQAFGPGGLGDYDKAVSAMEFVLDSREPAVGLYVQYAGLAYLAGQTAKATSPVNAPRSLRRRTRRSRSSRPSTRPSSPPLRRIRHRAPRRSPLRRSRCG